MNPIKYAVSAILCTLLLLAGLLAEGLSLAQFTAFNPAFYGQGESAAYDLIGKIVVRRISDAVLQNAPAIALQTTDRTRAYDLASEAFPPGTVAQMLESSGPSVARFLLKGGDVPVINGSDQLQAYETDAVKSLLMDDLASKIPDQPDFSALVPFTAEWNAQYGQSLTLSLALPRYYAGLTGYALAAAVALIVLLAGLLYLLWIRERKPFFLMTGSMLAFNGMLLLGLAAALSYGCSRIASDAASSPALTGAASLLASDWPSLVRAVLWPFRQIFFIAAAASLSLSAALFGLVEIKAVRRGAEPLWGYKPRHGRSKPPTSKAMKPLEGGEGIIELAPPARIPARTNKKKVKK